MRKVLVNTCHLPLVRLLVLSSFLSAVLACGGGGGLGGQNPNQGSGWVEITRDPAMYRTEQAWVSPAETILVYGRHMGVFGLTTNIAMFFVFFMGFKKAQNWAWWAFFFVAELAWIFGLVTQIAEGDMMNLIGHVIGILLWLIGILLPIKVFFPKKA